MPVNLRFDVTAAAALGVPQTVAASLFTPSLGAGEACTSLVVCLHGGTYNRGYWDFHLAGHPGYSMAAHLTAKGIAVLTLDTLGMGESTLPPHVDALTPAVVAAANDAVVREVRTRAARGELTPEMPPLASLRVVAIGHSMGGMLALIQQGLHRSYDGLAVLGWSTTRRWSPERIDLHSRGDHFLIDGDYRTINRAGVSQYFHWDDVPAAVIEADDRKVTPTPRTLEDACFVPGAAAEHAAEVDVPVFLAFGERDVSADPREERVNYPRATDITLFILSRAGHCHNFASTRTLLWDRLVSWLRACPTRLEHGN